jgi:hypothetical protein
MCHNPSIGKGITLSNLPPLLNSFMCVKSANTFVRLLFALFLGYGGSSKLLWY